jgi:TRIAD3 protein (E3 ubiquitin-protein ligase RNF216)
MISRMLQKRQLEEIEAAGIDLERCPFCDFMTVAPSDSKVFFCFNPQCMRDSCRFDMVTLSLVCS